MKFYFVHSHSLPASDARGGSRPIEATSISRALALTSIALVVLALMALTGCKDAGKTGASGGAGNPPPLSAPPSAAEPPPASGGGMTAPSPSGAASAPGGAKP